MYLEMLPKKKKMLPKLKFLVVLTGPSTLQLVQPWLDSQISTNSVF